MVGYAPPMRRSVGVEMRVGMRVKRPVGMRVGMRIGSVLAICAIVAGCGDRSAPPAGAPATEVTAPAVVVTDDVGGTTPVEPGTISVDPSLPPGVTDVPPTDVSPTDSTTSTVAGIESLQEVRTDDPLPPQPDGVADPAGAEAAIRFAYRHWILVDLDKDLRGLLVENGEENADGMQAQMESLRGTIEGGGIAVDEVTITEAERAVVAFHVTYQGRQSPIFPYPMTGGAVLQRGTWRITGNTLCILAFGVGSDCAGAGVEHPTPAAALQVNVVPDGFTFLGDCNGLINADTEAMWQGPNGATLYFHTETLVGLTRLSESDLDVLLQQTRFGGSPANLIEIGGRPGRYVAIEQPIAVPAGVDAAVGEEDPLPGVFVVQIRADDVVVTASGYGVDLDAVVAAIESMTPAEPMPCSAEIRID